MCIDILSSISETVGTITSLVSIVIASLCVRHTHIHTHKNTKLLTHDYKPRSLLWYSFSTLWYVQVNIAEDGTMISRTSSLVVCSFSLIDDDKSSSSEGTKIFVIYSHINRNTQKELEFLRLSESKRTVLRCRYMFYLGQKLLLKNLIKSLQRPFGSYSL